MNIIRLYFNEKTNAHSPVKKMSIIVERILKHKSPIVHVNTLNQGRAALEAEYEE